MQRFVIENFGCRASQADGAAIESILLNRGFEAAHGSETAELVVLNTCTVTANADDEVRQAVRRVHRDNPEARILVTGCYAQRAPREIASMEGVSWVVGNSHKGSIGELVTASADLEYHGQIHVGPIAADTGFMMSAVEDAAGERTRPNLKIQDGCNNRCSFCVIPSVRGPSRSAPAARVTDQVRALSLKYREVVLSGINLGRWGREPGSEIRLAGLLQRLLDETDIEKIRLSSVEPMDFSDELLQLMAGSRRICKHVHAPLQSGSDAVLRRMRRKYRPSHYESRIRTARGLMPDAAIGADVIVGFPGETDAEFAESLEFIERLPFTYLHVFTYSERPGTPAAAAPRHVDAGVKRRRSQVLHDVANRKNREFRARMVGKTLDAVTLNRPAAAITDNYIRVQLASERPPNRLIEVEIGAVRGSGIVERSLLPIL